MNPITQRANTPSQTNGATITTKTTSHKNTAPQEASIQDRQTNDRLIHLLGTMLVGSPRIHKLYYPSFSDDLLPQGLPVTLSLKNGELFSGIFAGATTEGQDPTYLLKMVRQIKSPSKPVVNGNNDAAIEYIGIGPDHSMSFGILDTANILAENVPEATPLVSQDGMLL